MIEIVICRDRSARLFWEALAETLRATPRFNVVSVEHEADVLPAIRDCNASLLICGGDLKISHRELFEDSPGLAIMRVDEDSAKTVVRTSQSVPVETRVSLDDPDCNLFVKLINRLFPKTDEETRPRLRLLEARDETAADVQLEEVASRYAPEFSDEQQSRFDVAIRRWIELVLVDALSHILANEPDSNNRVTGWGLSAKDAIALLGHSVGRMHDEQFHDEQRELSARIFWRSTSQVRCRFHWLAQVFGLTEFQQQILVLTVAPEIDGRFSRVFGCLNDDMSRRHATIAMLAELPLFPGSDAGDLMQQLFGTETLAARHLISVHANDMMPLCDAPIRVAVDILQYLACDDGTQETSTFHCYRPVAGSRPGRTTKSLRARLRRWTKRADDEGFAPTMNIDDHPDAAAWFIRGACEVGLSVVEIDLLRLADLPVDEAREHLLGAARTATVSAAAVLVTNVASVAGPSRIDLEDLAVEVLSSRVALLAIVGRFRSVGRTRSMSRIVRRVLDAEDRADLWLDYADRLGVRLSDDYAKELGAWARFSEADIEQTLYFARDKVMDIHLFKKAARHVSTTGIPSSVRRLSANFGWDDIVLPDNIEKRLRRIPDHITYREQVLTEWGYRERMSYGLGTACLFSGPSGTGKTMASQIIARAIGDAEIFQCDLAKTVSKYIGESEKNLDAIFQAAEKSRAVLVFDEADVLFGKRTEIRDAHDRYANLEVGYLLQRMEAYEGLVILTTNSRSSMDTSFLRRLRFIIEFPVPTAADREKIWQRVFPDALPRADDVSLAYIAQQLDLTGGHIQQAAIMAAYAAAAEKCTKVHMRHVIAATRDELAKLGMESAQRVLDEVAA